MRYWRARGVLRFELGGGGDHMAQYGGAVTPGMRFYRSRFATMGYGRALIRRVLVIRQMVSGLLAARRER